MATRLITCPACNGIGEIDNAINPEFSYKRPCIRCLGAGSIQSDISAHPPYLPGVMGLVDTDPEQFLFPEDRDSYYRRDRHDADYDDDI